jgi:hypothetical protein
VPSDQHGTFVDMIERCANRFHSTIGGPHLRMERLR